MPDAVVILRKARGCPETPREKIVDTLQSLGIIAHGYTGKLILEFARGGISRIERHEVLTAK